MSVSQWPYVSAVVAKENALAHCAKGQDPDVLTSVSGTATEN